VDAPRGPATPLHRTAWAKAYYVLHGRMIVQVENEAFDLGPGSSITIPPGALHTFTVLSPTARFLAVSLTGAMGRFHADLDARVPRGRPVEEVAQEIQQVLSRHEVTVAGFHSADLERSRDRRGVDLRAVRGCHASACFAWEVLLIGRPGVYEGVFGISVADLPAIRLWAFGVGFYNLFIACGLIAGVIAWIGGSEVVGRTLVIYLCLFAFLSGIVLFVADRMALGRPRGKGVGGALAQGVPPLIALVAAATAL
jgi:putative membrane protein